MNISCPDCNAVYEVDLPDLGEEGSIDVKCVKCQCVFAVQAEPALSTKQEAGQAGTESLTESPDADTGISQSHDQPHGDELDAFLDDLIEREISEDARGSSSQTDDGDEEPWDNALDDRAEKEQTPEDREEYILSRETAKTKETVPEEEEYLLKNVFGDETDDVQAAEDSHERVSAGEITETKTEETAPQKEEDLWAEVFGGETDGAQANDNQEEHASSQDTPETERDASDETEDLWSKAFSDQELKTTKEIIEPTAPREDETNKHAGISLGSEEDGAYGVQYDDEGDDVEYDELDFKPKKKKFGPFTLPDGKTGTMVIAGIFTAVLLIAGSAYFAMLTFAPPELVEIKKQATEIPEGLTPRDNLEENNLFAAKEEPLIAPPPEKFTDDTSEKPAQENKTGIAADLAKSKILKESVGVSQLESKEEINENTFAALNPSETMVTMSAILPVAYDANDIKILSFTLELDLTNQNTARLIRQSLPVYENIMVAAVEKFMSKQFYNDIIYVKEKLRKQFMIEFNKSLQGGRVRKARFREFLIQ